MQFEHFTIQLLTVADTEAYFRLIEQNRSRLEDFFAGTVAKTKTRADTETFVQEVVKKTSDRLYFPYIIKDNRSGEIAGFIDVKNIDWNIPKAELGCFADAAYAGTDVAYKALSLVIQHLFSDMGFNKLFLRTHSSNTAARALAEKCGFEKEGLIRRDYKTTKGELADLIYYGRINETV
jgi:RimJ/RimL family protein N-acetyltransferase